MTSLTNLHHLAQFCQVAGDEVEEGELVKVLGPLVAHFHHLVVSLQQCSLSQSLPAAALIQGLGSLQSHLGGRDWKELQREEVRVDPSVAQVLSNKVVNAGRLKLVRLGVAHLNVATLQSQAEASLLIFHKVQRHFRVAFLLQVGDDGLTDQLGITHHVQNLRGTTSQQ